MTTIDTEPDLRSALLTLATPPLQVEDRSAGGPSDRRVALAPAAVPSRRPAPTLDLPTLCDIATGLARAEELWRPHVRHDALSRTSVRLLATDAYEVWLLGWSAGQRVELHDHGGANAAFAVVEGELDEIRLGFAGTTTHRLRTGEVGTVPAGVVHDVVHAGTVDSASIHVYSDPLRTMTYYDADGSARYTEIVEQVPALASSPGRLLHPAWRR